MVKKILKLKDKNGKLREIKFGSLTEVDRFYNSYNGYYAWTIVGTVIVNKKILHYIYDDENGNNFDAFEPYFDDDSIEKITRKVKSLGRTEYKRSI